MTLKVICPTENGAEAEFVACIPHLRAFARFLIANREDADDLVQDAIVRALTVARRPEGVASLKAWMFFILRTLYYGKFSQNGWRIDSHDDAAHDAAMPPTREASSAFGDFPAAFWQLRDEQREVLILVGASGLSYEEVAAVCDCPIGTIERRVSRAQRDLLLRMVRWDSPADGECLDGSKAETDTQLPHNYAGAATRQAARTAGGSGA
jgi:RNA polymerase sigma-70 factor (ECF subfamily)